MSKSASSASSANLDAENNMSDKASAELTAVVDELLNQLSTKFSTISSEIVAKMDDMSRRLDKLEATIQSSSSARGDGEASK